MGGAFIGAFIGVNVHKKVIKFMYGLFLIWIALTYFEKAVVIFLK